MSYSDEKKELRGSSHQPAPPSDGEGRVDSAADDLTWQAVPEEPSRGAEPDNRMDADPDALVSALDRFLATPELEREGQASEIRELVTALREANDPAGADKLLHHAEDPSQRAE